MTSFETHHQSPLHSRHKAAGAHMDHLDGWVVPLDYGDASAEAQAACSHAAVADMTPTGRLRLRGDGALDVLEHCCIGDVAHQEDNTTMSTPLCNADGRPIDTVRLLRLDNYWLLLTAPTKRQNTLERLQSLANELEAKADDQTFKTAQLAVAGPNAPAVLDTLLPVKPSAMADGAVKTGSLLIAQYVAIRGRRGDIWTLEVIVPNMAAGMAWDFITRKAGANALPAMGMTAWNNLK